MSKLVNWDAVLPILDQVSFIRVYLTIVSVADLERKWYSTKESRADIEWRWQMAQSTVKYAIAQLTKKGLLNTQSRGVYIIEKKYLKETPKLTKD